VEERAPTRGDRWGQTVIVKHERQYLGEQCEASDNGETMETGVDPTVV